MSKTTNLLNEILKNGKNTNGKEWRDIVAAIKAKPDEYIRIYLDLRISLQILKIKLKA